VKPPLASGSTSVPCARVATLAARTPPVTENSSKRCPLGASTPSRKYLLLVTAQVSGPGTSSRSPGSSLPKATLLGSSLAGFQAYASWLKWSSVSRSLAASVAGMSTRRKAGPETFCTLPCTRSWKLSGAKP
jgi:hypothetical protein